MGYDDETLVLSSVSFSTGDVVRGSDVYSHNTKDAYGFNNEREEFTFFIK